MFVPGCRTVAAFSPTWGARVRTQYISELLSCTFTDVPAISQLHLYTSTFTGSDVMSPLHRSTVLCALQASCHAAFIIVLHKLVPGVQRIIRFETLNFDAELERMHNQSTYGSKYVLFNHVSDSVKLPLLEGLAKFCCRHAVIVR